jgi:hypothetical protein
MHNMAGLRGLTTDHGLRIRMMYGNVDCSKKLAPLLRQAFRQGVEAATQGDDRNPYVPDSYLYHAWVAGWAALARGWNDTDDLRLS